MSAISLIEIMRAADYDTVYKNLNFDPEINMVALTIGPSKFGRADILIDGETGFVVGLSIMDFANDVDFFYGDEEHFDCMYRNFFQLSDERIDKIITLECKDDALNKLYHTHRGEDYDKRVSIPVDIDNYELFYVMLQAHEKDMTLNDYVADIIMRKIEEEKNRDHSVTHESNCPPVNAEDIWTID